MREAIGGSLLMNLVVIFTGIVILFFVSIISYSKAYGVKNRIVNILEKYETYSEAAKQEINVDLKNVGYRATVNNKCDSDKIKNHLKEIGITNSNDLVNLNTNAYNYCLYDIKNKSSHESHYYVVVTFVNFEFPLIGDMLTFPVYGETRILGKNYNY